MNGSKSTIIFLAPYFFRRHFVIALFFEANIQLFYLYAFILKFSIACTRSSTHLSDISKISM